MAAESIFVWWRHLLRRRWLPGVVMFGIPFALGVTMLYRSAPVYRAEARVRLGDPPPMGGVSPNASVLGLLRMGGDPFANDLELFASRTVAEGVVAGAALHVSLSAPRGWHRDSLFTSLSADRATTKQKYEVEWRDGSVIVSTSSGELTRLAPGVPGSFGGVTVTARPWREPMPRKVAVSTIAFGEAVRATQLKLKFERARRDANVVVVNYTSTDPAVARTVVDVVLQQFVELRTMLVRRESGITVDSVRGVAARTRAELDAAEHALESIQRATGLIAPDAQNRVAVEHYAELSARLELARLELRTLTAALTRANAGDAAASWASLLAYPRFLANNAMTELVNTLTGLENQRRELARRRTTDNLELQVVIDRIRYMDESLRTLAADYSASLSGEVASLEAQEQQMRRQFAGLPTQMLELIRRQRDTRVLGEIVVVAEQRLRQEELRQALTFANVQVIDPPALRYRPVWPRKKLGTIVTLLIASATALVGMVVVDRSDGRVRNARHLRDTIGAPVLAALVLERDPPHVMDIDAVRTLLRRGVVEPDGIVRLAIADAGGNAVARTCADAIRHGATLGGGATLTPEIELLPAIDSYTAASAAAALRVPVVLALEYGRSDTHTVARAAEHLKDAGAELVGVIVVCRNAAAARSLWL